MYWISSSGYFDLQMTKAQAAGSSHQGVCDEDVRILSTEPKISRQLRKIDPEKLRQELKGYGAWDENELADHEQNLQRILWIAATTLNFGG